MFLQPLIYFENLSDYKAFKYDFADMMQLLLKLYNE